MDTFQDKNGELVMGKILSQEHGVWLVEGPGGMKQMLDSQFWTLLR